jgi:hypothetical protein
MLVVNRRQNLQMLQVAVNALNKRLQKDSAEYLNVKTELVALSCHILKIPSSNLGLENSYL